MGNYRFRLSDMMPNAWFYKLKDMGNKGRKSQTNSHSMKKRYPTTRTSPPTPPKPSTPPSPEPKQALLPRRGSYYISSRVETELFSNSPFHLEASDTHFLIDLPRRSKRRSRRKASKPSPTTKLVTSSVSSGRGCRTWKSEALTDFSAASLESLPCDRHHGIHGHGNDLHEPVLGNKIEFDGFDGVASWSRSCSFWVTTSATDIIIELGTRSSISRKLEKVRDYTMVPERGLPRIRTKPAKKEAGSVIKLDNANMHAKQRVCYNGCSAKEQSNSPVKKSPPGLHRLRMRESSPWLVSNSVEVQHGRKSSELAMTAKGLRESFAIIISSSDPQRDFRDSMVEMIVENNIRASKDLEELLACYLSLNSKEYHDVIIKVFEQIWFDLTNIRL